MDVLMLKIVFSVVGVVIGLLLVLALLKGGRDDDFDGMA